MVKAAPPHQEFDSDDPSPHREGRRFRLWPRRDPSIDRSAYLFLTPWFLGMILITAGPLLASLYLAFTDYHLLYDPSWIGLDNFRRILTNDARFLSAVWVTVRYVGISVPMQLAFALLLALILDKGVRGLSIYRGVYYLPSLLGSSVAVAILWRRVFGSDGLINWGLEAIGLSSFGSFIANPATALETLIVLNVWTFGAPMIIFLAGLRQIPTDLYEAASVDGAGTLWKFRSITLPMLTPIIFFNLVLQTIGAFQAFTPAHVISNGTGGPVNSTLFYTLYLYQQGFANFEMGYASALAWLLLGGISLLTGIHFLLARFWVFYGDE